MPWHSPKVEPVPKPVPEPTPEPRKAEGERRQQKLTAAQVIEMRALYSTGHSSADLGKKYGVSRTVTLKIIKGIYWGAVPGACKTSVAKKLTPDLEERPTASARRLR